MSLKAVQRIYGFGLLITCLLLPQAGVTAEQPVKDSPRGKLLYNLHCVNCHNEQKHWQANKKVKDWPTLVSQVKLWQNITNLKWDNKEIDGVARYLNTMYYHYPVPSAVASRNN